MKKVKNIILLCMVGLFMFGCNKDKGDIGKYAEKDIKEVMAYYDKGRYLCGVWIYTDTGERTISIYSEPKQVTNDTYKYTEELETYIKSNILTEHNLFEGDESGDGEQDTQKQLWSIRIDFTDGTALNFFSYTQYPENWDEFVALIEK